jgi:hypothetical protein
MAAWAQRIGALRCSESRASRESSLDLTLYIRDRVGWPTLTEKADAN